MQWSVVGHTEQKNAIERLLSEGGLPHALLLAGPQSVGKHLFALDILRRLVGVQQPLEQHPDVKLLAPGIDEETGKQSDIPVEQVRTMKTWAYQRPFSGSVKAVLIDDADCLGDAAANTLLKVLEEPPAYLHFVLVSSRPGALLETIASRCQELSFGLVSDAEMDTVLAGLRLDDDDRRLLRAVAGGRPGHALTLVREKRLPAVAHAIAQLGDLLKAGTAQRFVVAKALADDDALTDTVRWWLAWVHAQLPSHPRLAPVAHGLLELSSAVSEPKYNRRLALERFLLELG